MPHSPDKWKSFFADLGRPTKRGIRKCPKCGTVNGTRGNSCKNKACDVVFRDNGASKKSTTEACKVVANIAGLQLFSARLRDRGPDYRNFVQLPSDQTSAEEDASTAKCYVDACVKSKEFPCSHVQAAYRCFSESQPLTVKSSAVPTLNIPTEHQQIILAFMNDNSEVFVQRVSKTSFVVRCTPTSKHPLGFLHIMFFKHNKDDGMSEKKFLCTCKPFKAQNRQTDASQQQQQQQQQPSTSSNETIEIDAKFCLHYHACLCAFASDDSLSAEFEYFLLQTNQTCSATLLGQFHLVTLPPPVGTTTVDGIDTSHISVEIMQENISLLESIAAADDATLHNVQGLEGVLSDQIIVTNVDDSLTFGDTTGLEGLDDGDSQACQIFANAQNAIQLAGGYTNPDAVHQTISISTSNMLGTPVSTGKKRRQGSGSADTTAEIVTPVHTVQQTQIFTTGHIELANKSSFASKGAITGTITATFPAQPCSSGPTPPTINTEPEQPIPDVFDIWLSGVNERLNAAMNYHFDGKPEPFVYYISTEYFEQLKERITMGLKKKRLPNQTVIITRLDKPPVGTFTKHVWKITNVFHVLQIFQNPLIPLKIRQYFLKGNHGMYDEWIPPNETDRKNQQIKPHLYSTYLKVGKSDPNSTESVPFIIEWIGDIFPQSNLGELTLVFEFGRSAPRDEAYSYKIAKTALQRNV